MELTAPIYIPCKLKTSIHIGGQDNDNGVESLELVQTPVILFS